MQETLGPIFGNGCFDPKQYDTAKESLKKAKELISELDSSNVEKIGNCFKEYLENMMTQSKTVRLMTSYFSILH